MKRGTMHSGCAALLLLVITAPSHAQHAAVGARSPTYVGAYAGWTAGTQLLDVEGALRRAGETTPGTRFLIDIGTQPAPVFGVTFGRGIRRELDLRLSASVASTEFSVAGALVQNGRIEDLSRLGGVGRVYISTVDAALLWQPAFGRRVLAPYALVGAGVVVHDFNDPADFDILTALTGIQPVDLPRTDIAPAATFGLGARVRFTRSSALWTEAAAHIAAGPLGDNDFASADPDFAGTTDGAEIALRLRLAAGISLGIGR